MTDRITHKCSPHLNERQKELDILACKLMLAYMATDPAERALKVWTVEHESDLSREALDSAGITAWQAAQFWRATNPGLGEQLLQDRLIQLAEVSA